LHAYGGGAIGGRSHGQSSDKETQSKKPQLATQDSIERELQNLEKILDLDDVQKIKFEKFSTVMKDDFYALNNIQRSYGDFIINGNFDKQSFLNSAQKKTKLLPEIQGEFISNLFSILTSDQKDKLRGAPLLLLWQK
jgi:hypothetical protein